MAEGKAEHEDRGERGTLRKPEPAAESAEGKAEAKREIGGRDGPEPTRYGDWEKNGRCIDF